jgi:hypothetical protein
MVLGDLAPKAAVNQSTTASLSIAPAGRSHGVEIGEGAARSG